MLIIAKTADQEITIRLNWEDKSAIDLRLGQAEQGDGA